MKAHEKVKKVIHRGVKTTTSLRKKIYNFLQVVKRGYNEISWILYLTTAVGILTSLFHLQLTGFAAWLFSFFIFYVAGKFFISTEKLMSEENARKAKG